MKDWYRCTETEVLKGLQTTRDGLTEKQVQQRRKQYGANVIRESRQKPAWKVFAEQFQDLLVMILIGAAVISMVTDNLESTVVIFAVITLNAVLGTVQHQKAQKSLESLRALSSPAAVVLRDGSRVQISSEHVVPGDILCLEAGDLVVADGRILESVALQINESSLTGESEAVMKQERALARELPLADRTNMVYSGSLVTGGRGMAVVTDIAMDTEIGRIAAMMSDAEEKKTPLQASLDQFGSRLAAAIMVICLIVFGLSLYRGMAMLDSLMFAVALAVAAIPEALGSIVTIVQAMGTQKMAKEQAIIKDLKAVESLGCVSVICTDKTGTLTQNRMTVEQIVIDKKIEKPERIDASKSHHRLFMEICGLVNDASIKERGQKGSVGDATELALLEFLKSRGISVQELRSRFPRKREIAFDSERKLMSTVHCLPEGWMVLCKGAADVLLERCSQICDRGKVRPISGADLKTLQKLHDACSGQGLRVIAAAYRPVEQEALTWPDQKLEQELIFLGMVAMIDPPRPETMKAVADARRAGIRPVMITGDHKVTAMAIGAQIGILNEGEAAVTGAKLDEMGDQELGDRLEEISIYSRVTPEHKLRIVKAWQSKGKIVAMTGDGVNDAPALKQADIGVAMGRTGTEVSKDAASMILADDNFATIMKAVANGRNVYRNIRNAIEFLLSGNMAGILCVLYTTFRGLPMPFAPVHLLFINLLTDSLPAIAIGMEQPQVELLDCPPRDPKKGILTARFIRDILIQGGLIAVCTMSAYCSGFYGGGNPAGGSSVTAGALASTMAFATLTLARLFHGFNCRGGKSIFELGITSNLYVVMAWEAGVLLMAAVLFVPKLQVMFSVSDLTVPQLVTVVMCACFPTVVIQMWKVLRRIKHQSV